jgi:hypothetical protein
MITVGNGTKMKVEEVGKLKSCVKQYDEKKTEITLENVQFMPHLWINLFSIDKALKNLFMIGNEGILIKLTKREMKLVFDHRLNTKVGFMSGIKMEPVLKQVDNHVVETKKMIKTMSV